MDPWVPGYGLHHISWPDGETLHNYIFILIVVACNCTIINDNKPIIYIYCTTISVQCHFTDSYMSVMKATLVDLSQNDASLSKNSN